jgi:hypothetical protein
MDGGGFFYPNPLESMGQHQRQPWFGCACCPSNICRFLPSLPGYVYAVKDRNLYVNLFLSNTSRINLAGKAVSISQDTQYPWNGDIALRINGNKAGQFALKIRIPGWVKGHPVPSDLYEYADHKRMSYKITVNGRQVPAALTPDGYYTISRKWKKGDRIQVHFDMEARIVRANNKVVADRGQVAIERGPVVYCAEWPDNAFNIMNVLLNQTPQFTSGTIPDSRFIADSLKDKLTLYKDQSLKTLTTQAQTLAYDSTGNLTVQNVTLKLIPYFSWCQRGSGNMKVWIPQDLKAVRPAVPATLASLSKIASSTPSRSLGSIADGLVPADENDRSIPYFHWWPKQGTTEWITYTFPKERTIQTSTVYWYDDQPWGGCKVPEKWSIQYMDQHQQWQDVKHADHYPIQKGQPCTVEFDPIKTKVVRINVKQPEKYSCGLFEWSVN